MDGCALWDKEITDNFNTWWSSWSWRLASALTGCKQSGTSPGLKTSQGWLSVCAPLFSHRGSITIMADVLLFKVRVVVPTKACYLTLKNLHRSPLGQTKCWPGPLTLWGGQVSHNIFFQCKIYFWKIAFYSKIENILTIIKKCIWLIVYAVRRGPSLVRFCPN